MLKTAAVNKILPYVLRRSMACAAVHSLLIAAIIVLFVTVTEGSPDRPLQGNIEAAFIVVLILFLGLLLIYSLTGMFAHVPAVQELGFEPTPGNLSPYQSRAVPVRGGSAYAIRRARRILQKTDGVRIIEHEPYGTRVKAVRKAHDDAGYAQLIEITADPSEGATNVEVRSRPRFHLAPFDRGQNLVNVESIAAELGSP